LTNFDEENFFKNGKDFIYQKIQERKIEEYIHLYKDQFFCEYPTNEFVDVYYPIIENREKIDKKYINYVESIQTFFKELNEKEGLNEKFFVDKLKVKINYLFYCVLANCKKHILEEKTIKFQKFFRRFKVRNLMKRYIEKAKIIQRKWKEHYYLNKNDLNLSFKYIVRSSFTKDPLISKLFNVFKGNYQQLISHNEELMNVMIK
jgi:hypothetical protein